MTIGILTVILASAVCHATWNITLSHSKHTLSVCILQMLFASVWLLPAVFLTERNFSVQAIPTIIVSVLMQTVYYYLLVKCYSSGDISAVYPLVRGSAPVYVCIFSMIMGTEDLTVEHMLCLLLIIAGIYLVNMPSLKRDDLLEPFRVMVREKSLRIAGLVGVTIAVYTISDKRNVMYVDPLLLYYILVVFPGLFLLPLLFKSDHVKTVVREEGFLKITAVSVFTFLAYFLVLVAMKYTNAGYVSAIREVSVLFVVLYEAVKYKNINPVPKAVGAVMIIAGIIWIAL